MNRKLFFPSLFALSLRGAAPPQDSAVSKGLALTPTMGWNTWNKFGCNVSEELVRGVADAMVKSRMKNSEKF
ncbi:MAG TPA: hypothetical protein VMG30_06225 [Acidobacteriota bacterium]|nr:hypothetical protein [Acidobacteriota bacterium]